MQQIRKLLRHKIQGIRLFAEAEIYIGRMNMMKVNMMMKLAVFIFAMLIALTGCEEDKNMNVQHGDPTPVHDKAFNEAKAVDLVLKDHPEFPEAGEVKKIETQTGGPALGTVSGELKTAVEKSDSENDTYIVTLTKV